MAAIPEVKKLATKFADQGLVVVGASLDAEPNVKAFKAKSGIQYALLAGSQPLAIAFNAQLFPALFLVGKDGKVIWKGEIEDKELVGKIEAALR